MKIRSISNLAQGLAAGAAVIALWLGVQQSGLVTGSCGGSGCDNILSSKWSRAGGIPIAFLGAAVWGALAISGSAVWQQLSIRKWLGIFAITCTVLAAGWCGYLMLVVERSLCVWCATGHGLALAAVTLFLVGRRQPPGPPSDAVAASSGRASISATAAGALSVGLLAAFPAEPQATLIPLPPPPAAQTVSDIPPPAPQAQDWLVLHGGKALIDPAVYPSLGAEKFTGVFLMDFTCPHCRRMLGELQKVVAAKPGTGSISILPVWHDEDGQRVQRLMQSLFAADRTLWDKLKEGLLDGSIPSSPDAVARAAMEFAGPTAFGDALAEAGPSVLAQLTAAQAVYELNQKVEGGSPALPQLMNDKQLMTGSAASAETLPAFLSGGPLATRPPGTSPATTGPAPLVNSPQPIAPPPAPVPVSQQPQPSPPPAMPPAGKLPQYRPRPLTPQEMPPAPPPGAPRNEDYQSSTPYK